MEVRYLEHSEASAMGGQVLDGNLYPQQANEQCPMLQECLMQT